MNPLQVVTCLGLGTAAGLNMTLPVLIVGVLAWSGALTLQRPFTFLGTGPVLVVLGMLAAVEMLGDKTVVRRGALHLVTLPSSIGAAAVLSAASLNQFGTARPGLALVLPTMASCLVAGGVHVGRTLLRPTAHRMGPGTTILVSWIEDVLSALVTLGALLAPMALLVVFAMSLAGAARVGLWVRATARRGRLWLTSLVGLVYARWRFQSPATLNDSTDDRDRTASLV